MPSRSASKSPITKSFTVEVYVQSNYYCSSPTHAVINISHEDAVRIRKMQFAVKTCKAYCIEAFDSTPDYMESKDSKARDGSEDRIPPLEEWCGRYECSTLHVTDSRFYWKALLKNTDIYMETDPIDIKEVKQL